MPQEKAEILLFTFQILAVIAAVGCVNATQAAANVARTLRASGKSVPIYKGADKPMPGGVLDSDFYVQFFGEDGIGDRPNAFPKVMT